MSCFEIGRTMTRPILPAFLAVGLAVTLSLLGVFLVWPECDVMISGLFYAGGQGFPLAQNHFFQTLQNIAFYGARALGVLLLIGVVFTFITKKTMATLPTKSWLFLFLVLLIGPGLVANLVFKDHWGRARPREIVEFGGIQKFSPAFLIQDNGRTNSSFISGDAAFGFSLCSLAYVVPRNRSKRVFWNLLGFGSVFGLARLFVGAHFFSDILCAGLFMLVIIAGFYAVMYGGKSLKDRAHLWFS
jgi:lipid A 4'-phosphatase